VPFAVVFGLLTAAEDLFLGWLTGWPHPTLDWFVIAPAVLAVLAAAGAFLVFRGRARGWLVSVVADEPASTRGWAREQVPSGRC
jgi:hypothetical protein